MYQEEERCSRPDWDRPGGAGLGLAPPDGVGAPCRGYLGTASGRRHRLDRTAPGRGGDQLRGGSVRAAPQRRIPLGPVPPISPIGEPEATGERPSGQPCDRATGRPLPTRSAWARPVPGAGIERRRPTPPRPSAWQSSAAQNAGHRCRSAPRGPPACAMDMPSSTVPPLPRRSVGGIDSVTPSRATPRQAVPASLARPVPRTPTRYGSSLPSNPESPP